MLIILILFTVKKSKRLKQIICIKKVNVTAWNNNVCLIIMINRNSRGYPYLEVRGEILGFSKDEQLRKHLSRMFSLIKNESLGIEDD